MAVVGSAEVVVRAITNRIKKDIEKAFSDAMPSVRAAGDKAGKEFASSFENSAGNGIHDAVDNAFSGINARDAGDKAGRDFAEAAAGGVGGGGGRIGDEAERSFGNAGRRGGNSFKRAMTSAWADTAVAASAAFTPVFAVANILGTGMAAAASGLSAIVSGLYAIVSAAGAAAGALAVLPGILGMALQAGAGLKLAFSGVGAALSAGMKQATTATKAAGTAAASNANAIADAQRNLQRAFADAARAKFDADKRVAEAARGVAEAEREVLSITKELNRARKEAAESLQQLAFDAEDAALSEERAALGLEDAYAKYLAVQNLPADDRTRREAELAYKEAELSYRQAKDRNADLAKEQKRAAKAGIKGSDEVLSVKEKIAAAEKTLADRERQLADAKLARQRAMADSAERIADAQRALTRAMQQSNNATAAGAKTADAYAQAMSDLSPAAQDFVRYLISIQGALKGVKAAAGSELFPKLQTALQPIVSKLFPVFERQLRTTGGILGDFAIGFSNAITRGSMLEDLMRSQNETLNVFNQRGANGRTVIDDLATVALRLMTAIQPLTKRFAEWVAVIVEGWEAATRGSDAMGRMTGFFEKAGDRAALLGDIVSNLFGIFKELGRAADPAGTGLLRSFEAYTRGLREFLEVPENNDKLKGYFEEVADNVRDISDMVRALGRAFGGLGDNRAVGDFAKSLEPAIKNFGQMADNMTSASPALGEFITHISEIMLAFADTKGIQLFFDTLNLGLSLVTGFVGTGFGKWLVTVVGAIAAVTRALSFMRMIGNKALQIFVGGPIKAIRWLFRLDKQADKTRRGIAGLSPASDAAKAAFERQMKTDALKVKALKRVETQSILTAKALQRVKTAGAPAAGAAATAAPAAAPRAAAAGAGAAAAGSRAGAASAGAAAAAANTSRLGKAAGAASRGVSALGKGFGALAAGLIGVSGPVLAVIAGIVLLVIGLKKLYSASPQFKKFVDGIVDKLKAMGNWFKNILTKYVVPFLDGFFSRVNKVMPKISEAIGGFMKSAWDKLKPILGALGTAFTTIFNGVKYAVNNIFVPGMKMIWSALQTMWAGAKPILEFFWKAIQVAFNIIKGIIKNVWLPYAKLIIGGIKMIWGVAKKIFSGLSKVVSAAFSAIKAVWNSVLKPVLEGLKRIFNSVRNVVGNVVGFMIKRWNNFKANFEVLKTVVGRIVTNIRNKFDDIKTKVTSVVDAAKDKFASFKTTLTTVWEKVRTVVGNIKTKFGEIAGAVTGAFKGLGSKAVGGINKFIKFLNEKLIANVNKITGKFGLKIDNISPISGYAKGGYTGNISPRAVAGVVHGDEHVIKSSSRRAIERAAPGALEYMNRTGKIPYGVGGFGFPDSLSNLGSAAANAVTNTGGWLRDLAGSTIGGVKNVGEKIAKHGVGYVLEKLVSGARGLMGSSGIKRGAFINDFFYGIMDSLTKKVKTWGGHVGEQAGGEIPPKSGPWGHPLYTGAPITQYPNKGHRPSWSVDFGVPTGTRVKAASSGTVASVIDKGAASYGKYIVLAHAKGIRTLYAHLSSFAASVGAKVRTGQTIGYSGSTGRSTGPHLHFELMPGSDTLAELRKRGVKLAQGGVAKATPGGVLSVIAEAGHNERVEPLDSEGMSKRDRVMLGMIQAAMANGQQGKGDTFHVHPAPGMDEAALAHMVSRQVAWRRSVGT